LPQFLLHHYCQLPGVNVTYGHYFQRFLAKKWPFSLIHMLPNLCKKMYSSVFSQKRHFSPIFLAFLAKIILNGLDLGTMQKMLE
jgi:hypothetical protein